jgi:hypothetical protein
MVVVSLVGGPRRLLSSEKVPPRSSASVHQRRSGMMRTSDVQKPAMITFPSIVRHFDTDGSISIASDSDNHQRKVACAPLTFLIYRLNVQSISKRAHGSIRPVISTIATAGKSSAQRQRTGSRAAHESHGHALLT